MPVSKFIWSIRRAFCRCSSNIRLKYQSKYVCCALEKKLYIISSYILIQIRKSPFVDFILMINFNVCLLLTAANNFSATWHRMIKHSLESMWGIAWSSWLFLWSHPQYIEAQKPGLKLWNFNVLKRGRKILWHNTKLVPLPICISYLVWRNCTV